MNIIFNSENSLGNLTYSDTRTYYIQTRTHTHTTYLHAHRHTHTHTHTDTHILTHTHTHWHTHTLESEKKTMGFKSTRRKLLLKSKVKKKKISFDRESIL